EALANVSPAPEFHFIGGLQSRKVRALMGRVSLIHSVDRIRLLQEIDRHAGEHGMVQDVLLEVNTGGEETKSGCAQEELPGLLDAAASFRSIRVLGLMAIPPWDPDPEAARPHFQALRRLRDTHAPRLPELSMGMSHDLEVAVEEGATLVRVGTALFGSRSPGVP
ncbi:MAG: YggS family pyridoxal phosphate-dependent enzyme, partial [Deltaproteobacteria bacterium]|nr:YggS family pyridoxal phosphate-dependent enzyme [Deltaproteobacteria bacterium]